MRAGAQYVSDPSALLGVIKVAEPLESLAEPEEGPPEDTA
jgi:hypothetical protein